MLESAYDLRIHLEMDHLEAELILLAERTSELPAGYTEADRRIHFTSEAGTILPLSSRSGHDERAAYYPPYPSEAVRVGALLEVDLEHRPPGQPAQSVQITRRADFLILAPADASVLENGFIDDFRIGHYLDTSDPAIYERYFIQSSWHKKHPERYQVPNYFYKVTEATTDLKIAPHQTLGFYAMDYPWKSLGLPHYIALDLHLVRKVEDLIDLLQADGRSVTGFTPIYGFRSPAFNLGTIKARPDSTLKEPLSMHQYGRAVDLIVDEDGDGLLDDLNGDGHIDIHDAEVLMRYVNHLDRAYRARGEMNLVGGAGLYSENDFIERNRYFDHNTPYIHIDTRGFLADNGHLIRWPARWPDGSYIAWGDI